MKLVKLGHALRDSDSIASKRVLASSACPGLDVVMDRQFFATHFLPALTGIGLVRMHFEEPRSKTDWRNVKLGHALRDSDSIASK